MSKAIADPKKSAMHKHVVWLLQELWPNFKVEQEKVCEVGDQRLFCDIALPQLRLVIECHGRQHFEFVRHFHGTEQGFEAAKRRDADKARTIDAAGWFLLVIRYDEWEKLTRAKLAKRISKAMEG